MILRYYELGENIIIDESLQHFKKKKTHYTIKPQSRLDFKVHILSDYNTGYLYNLVFEPMKTGNDIPSLYNLSSDGAVNKLTSCINDNKKRNIFLEEYYSSNIVLKKLEETGNFNTTILKMNGTSNIRTLNDENASKKDDSIIVTKDEGKKEVILKNKASDSYDCDLDITSSDRNTKKWYSKVLFFGIDAGFINAKILYEKKAHKTLGLSEFKDRVCKLVFKMYREYCKNNAPEKGEDNPKKKDKKIPPKNK